MTLACSARSGPDIALISQLVSYSLLAGVLSLWPTASARSRTGRTKYVNTSAQIAFILALLVSSISRPQYRDGITSAYLDSLPPDYRILARRESITGFISVGEYLLPEHRRWIRFLRADHSLLGGVWYDGPESGPLQEAESIYTAFHLQEAVRLVEPPPTLPDGQGRPRALIIGLGIGTAVQGLEQHGVQTTVVEIDPVVYEFARRFFGLKKPSGGVHLRDARIYLRQQQKAKFSYIVHDVFTGGVIPASLLTLETWQAIANVLTPDGIVAIVSRALAQPALRDHITDSPELMYATNSKNFAGQPNSGNGKVVLATILDAFAHCRAFADVDSDVEHLNMVVFCSGRTLHFREARESDFLGSHQRRQALQDFQTGEITLHRLEEGARFTDANAGKLDSSREIEDHWHIMRSVLPDYVWQLW